MGKENGMRHAGVKATQGVFQKGKRNGVREPGRRKAGRTHGLGRNRRWGAGDGVRERQPQVPHHRNGLGGKGRHHVMT